MPETENLLIVTVGLPKAGKTTWALSTGHPIVNLSAIRKSLYNQRFIIEMEPWIWNLSRLMVKSLFEAGHKTVILDGTAILEKQREPWRNLDYCKTHFKLFDADMNTCINRAKDQGDIEIIPIIESMGQDFENFSDLEILTEGI